MTSVEDERLIALRELAILDTPAEERFDRITRLAQRLFDVPMVAMNLIDADRQWAKSSIGIDANTPRNESFCTETIEQDAALVVPDAQLDLRFAANPKVTGDPHIRFYAGQPLTAPGGQRVGTLCILDSRPRTLTQADLDLLHDLGRWIERELATQDELDRAAQVQRGLMPASAPTVPGYDIAGICLPAREVGGDFFDWSLAGDDLLFSLADVMGKGVPAAIIGATVRAVLRGASRFNDVSEAVRRTAWTLDSDFAETGTFATLFSGRLNVSEGVITYVDAGHGLSMVVGSDGSAQRLASADLPLGVPGSSDWAAQKRGLRRGESFVSVSDGLLDYFEDTESMTQVLARLATDAQSAQGVIDAVVRLTRTRALQDDVTVLVIHRNC